MYYNESSWEKISKRYSEVKNELIEEYGHKKCIKGVMIAVVSVAVLLSLFVVLRAFKFNEKTSPWLISTTIGEEKEIPVVRTGKMGEGISMNAMALDLVSAASPFASEVDAISLFDDLTDACGNIGEHLETLIIPSEAGGIEFEMISVYGWKKSWTNFLGKEFDELHMVMTMYSGYVYVVIEWTNMFSFEIGIEIGDMLS